MNMTATLNFLDMNCWNDKCIHFSHFYSTLESGTSDYYYNGTKIVHSMKQKCYGNYARAPSGRITTVLGFHVFSKLLTFCGMYFCLTTVTAIQTEALILL